MKRFYLTIIIVANALTIQAQQDVTVSGSIQSDMLLSTQNKDDATSNDDFMTNTYADVLLQSQYVDAGTRFEYMEHPLPGFENDFKGWGVPHFWVKGKFNKVELTAGTFYEQFGSGFILRSYEERSLGIDNSLLGGRIVVKPMNGLTLKVLSGKQRHYWKWDGGLVSGADAEVSLDEWVPSLQQHDTRLSLGASWVNKYEKDEDIFVDPTHRLNLPKFVNAWESCSHALRLLLQEGIERPAPGQAQRQHVVPQSAQSFGHFDVHQSPACLHPRPHLRSCRSLSLCHTVGRGRMGLSGRDWL